MCVGVTQETLSRIQFGIERLCSIVQIELVVTQNVAILNLDDCAAVNDLTVDSGNNSSFNGSDYRSIDILLQSGVQTQR